MTNFIRNANGSKGEQQVRRHAKTSSGGSTSGIGSSRSPLRRAASATRGASGVAKGTGAFTIVRTAIALCCVLIPASAFAASAQAGDLGRVGQIPAAGGAGAGALSSPRTVAANRTGAGGVTAGDVYVLDANNRVSQFSATGAFIRAFGYNVVSSGEHDVGVGPEICEAVSTPTDVCQAGTANVLAGGLSNPQGIAVDQSTGNLYVYEAANRRVSVFSAKGVFEGAFGWKVKAGVEAAAELQFCTTAGTGCQAGESTGAAGGFASSTASPLNVSLDSSGRLYVPDAGNLRIDVFSPTLNGSNEVTGAGFVRAIGYDVISGGAEGTGNINGTTSVSGVATTKKAFLVGQTITGAGIAPGTTITAVAATSLTLSQAATATATGVALTAAEGSGNVVQNEKQIVTVPVATGGGTFTLTFTAPNPQPTGTNPQTAAAIPYNATAAEVEAKLAALSNLGAANVAVTGAAGGPYTVEFKGTRFADTNVAQMTASGAGLTPSGTVSVATIQEGTALETCTVASGCKAGSAGGGDGQFRAGNPSTVAIDSSGSIYAATVGNTAACSPTLPCRIQKFNPDGTISDASFGPETGECATVQTSAFNNGPSGSGVLTVAVDPATDNLLVFRKVLAQSAKICELGGSSGEVVDVFPATSLSVAEGTSSAGLATGTGGRVYATDGSPVYILGPVPAPEAQILPATEITQTSAKLNGKVTVPPPGGESSTTVYHFELSADGGFHWINVPASDVLLGSTPGTFAVNQTATGLQPGANYLVRLVATTGPSATSAQLAFTTTGAAPSVFQYYGAKDVTPTSAKLAGTVNPNNSPTTYRFEYGTTTAYGRQSPAEFELFLGSGGSAVGVNASLGGLEPNTTYHWRIVATNAVGTTKGADRQFTTYQVPEGLNAAGLPDNRGVELVSPPDKRPVGNMEQLGNSQRFYQATESGDRMGYYILNGTGDSPGGGEVIYAASRSSAGWSSTEISSPPLVPAPDATNLISGVTGLVKYLDPEDLKCALLETHNPLSADTPAADVENGVYNLYRWNASDETYTLITNRIPLNPSAPKPAGGFYAIAGASADCSRIFFYSNTYSFINGASGLYEWDHGTLRDAALRPDGSVPAFSKAELETVAEGKNSVSHEGRFFFQAKSNQGADATKQAVFVRKGPATATGTGDVTAASTAVANVFTSSGAFSVGQTITGIGIPAGTTIASLGSGSITLSQPATTTGVGVALKASEVVDASQPTNGPTLGAQYEGASPDGGHVFFLANYGIAATSSSGAPNENCSSIANLSNTACDLYDYDVETGQLTDISADTNSADTRGAVAQGVMAISEDGSVVYFSARGQLVPSEGGRTYAQNLAGSGHANVYRYDAEAPPAEALTYVGSLTARDVIQQSQIHSRRIGNGWSSQTSEDGSYFLYASRDNLTVPNPLEVESAYLFSTATGSSTGSSLCVSCPADGGAPKFRPPAFELGMPAVFLGIRPGGFNVLPVSLSEDGRVIFNSEEVLAPGAIEGHGERTGTVLVSHPTQTNVYEWHQGQVALLATGAVEALGMGGPNGRDVFVKSFEQLSGQDFDFNADVYDFRSGGGFAPPPNPPTPCDPAADQCQGTPSPQPATSSPASAAFQDPGNPRPCPSGKVRRGERCVSKLALARRACRKKHGKAKRRCIAKQVRRLDGIQRPQSRAANTNRGGAK